MKKKVLLVGGSALGVQIADQLIKSDLVHVTMIEKNKLSEGMSAKAGTLLHTFQPHPVLSDLATESLSLYSTSMASQTRDFFTRTGSLTILSKPQLHKARQEIRRLKMRGSSLELLSSQSAAKKFPEVLLNNKEHVVYDPDAGLLDATGLSGSIAASHNSDQFQVLEETAVEEILIENNKVLGVRTAEGDIRSDLTIVTAGVHTLNLLRNLGLATSVGISNLESHVYESASIMKTPPFVLDPNNGGCAKFERTKEGTIRSTLFTSTPSTRFSLGEKLDFESPAAQTFRKRLAQSFPFLRYASHLEGSNLIDVRDNKIPGSIGYVPGTKGLYAAYGWGRRGLTMAPAIAREVSRQIVRNWVEEKRAFSSFRPRQEFTA